MKRYFSLFPLIVGVVANQAFAQQEQTSESLVIDTAIDFTEENIDRTVIHDGSGGYIRAAVLVDDAGASYTGTDVNLSIDYSEPIDDDSIYGIRLDAGKSINLNTSGEGVWNTVTVSGSGHNVHGISLVGSTDTSRISNTEITVAGSTALGVLAQSSGDVELDNVNIHLSSSPDNSGVVGYGIWSNGSNVTNAGKGQVTITSDFTGNENAISCAVVAEDGSVDLHDTTISMAQAGTPGGASYGVLTSISASSESFIYLTDSSISCANGSVLALIAGGNASSTIVLDHVDLSNAKDQAIIYAGSSTLLALSHGTNLDGYLQEYAAEADFAIDIDSGASWNVTRNSTTGEGSVYLGAGSTISFVELSEGTFTNISAASVALREGAILMLGATAEEIQALIDGNGGAYDVELFVTDNEFSNEGVILVSSDGQAVQYETDNLGTYTLLGTTIPEPTTASFGLAALSLLALRRNKK